MKLTIYIWFSLVLLTCFAFENNFEEYSGNSLVSSEQNGITKSESAKKVGTIVAVATIGAVLVIIGTIQPLLLLVPLVIAWIGLTGYMTLIGVALSNTHFPEPIEFIFWFIPMLFISPFYALAHLPVLPSMIGNLFDTPRHLNYDLIQ